MPPITSLYTKKVRNKSHLHAPSSRNALLQLVHVFENSVIQRRRELKHAHREWSDAKEAASSFDVDDTHILQLDVGGTPVTTLLSTLTCVRDCMLYSFFSDMFGGPEYETEDDRIFMDRDGSLFANWVLPFLRTYKITEPDRIRRKPKSLLPPGSSKISKEDRYSITREAFYYGIDELVQAVQALNECRLRRFDQSAGPGCVVEDEGRKVSWRTGRAVMKTVAVYPSDLGLRVTASVKFNIDVNHVMIGFTTLKIRRPDMAQERAGLWLTVGGDVSKVCDDSFLLKEGQVLTVYFVPDEDCAKVWLTCDGTGLGPILSFPSYKLPSKVWAVMSVVSERDGIAYNCEKIS